jgi:hypothetical protein
VRLTTFIDGVQVVDLVTRGAAINLLGLGATLLGIQVRHCARLRKH